MNILKYIAYHFKADTPQLRAEAAESARKWMNDNMADTYKWEDSYQVNYQAYMKAYINSYLSAKYKATKALQN